MNFGAVDFSSAAELGWKENTVDRLTNDMADQNMGLLDARASLAFGSPQQIIHFTDHFTAAPAGETDGCDPKQLACFNRSQHIR